MTNTLEGRELAVACARAMGLRVDGGDVSRSDGVWRGPVDADGCYECGQMHTGLPTVDEMLAWLTKDRRGCVQTSHEEDWCYSRFIAYGSLMRDQDRPCGGGATLHEALQRLVVAVAEGKR